MPMFSREDVTALGVDVQHCLADGETRLEGSVKVWKECPVASGLPFEARAEGSCVERNQHHARQRPAISRRVMLRQGSRQLLVSGQMYEPISSVVRRSIEGADLLCLLPVGS